jgi:hypothetical protein
VAEKKGEHFDDNNEHDLLEGLEGKKNAHRMVNRLDEEKKEEMIEGLMEFQKKTGIDESEYINRIKKCKSGPELQRIETQTKKAGVKWYKLQLVKSGLYEPIDDRERSFLSSELQGSVDWFEDLKLTGDFSMISVLSTLTEEMKPRQEFRQKLKKQSSFIKNEYFSRLGSLSMYDSKEALLNNILRDLKGLENAPSAVQFEFKKIQKNANSTRLTEDIRKEVMENYDKLNKKYVGSILKNKDNFGGKSVHTPFGKIPITAWEFIQWFEERKSFADMDAAIRKLPGMIEERERLYNRRDDILKNALPKDRTRLVRLTDDMRRHELEEFLPELEEHVRKNNIHTAEYVSSIIQARAGNVHLFPGLERVLKIRKFKLADIDTQKAYLKVLKAEIRDRDRTVREYLSLPHHVRDDYKFMHANAATREEMLLDAQEQLNREDESPFDKSSREDLDGEDVQDITENLQSHEGEEVMDEIVEEMEREGLTKAVEIQEQTYMKIFGTAKRADRHNETQKESYKRDLKHWIRMDDNIKHHSDARNAKEHSKLKYIEAADEAYDKGFAVTSGGEVRRLAELDANQLAQGSKKAHEDLKRARYGEHVVVKKKDGEMAQDPLEMIESLSQKELMKLVLVAINKLGRGKMGLSGTDTALLKNSNNLQQEIGEKIIDREFKHFSKNNIKLKKAA